MYLIGRYTLLCSTLVKSAIEGLGSAVSSPTENEVDMLKSVRKPPAAIILSILNRPISITIDHKTSLHYYVE